MEVVYLLAYAFFGYNSNMYLRRNLLGQVGVVYSDTGSYIMSQIIWGILLGWITIPLALIIGIFKNFISSK